MRKEIKITVRASGASTWANCPASEYIKTGRYPYEQNTAALFGNAVHAYGAAYFLKEKPALSLQEFLAAAERPEDFKEYLDFYIKAVNEWRMDGETIIEQLMTYENEKFIISGHGDFIVWKLKKNNLKIQAIDLKTGKIPIDPNDNLQVFCYGHLAINELMKIKKIPHYSKLDSIEINGIIVQPAHNEIKFAKILFDWQMFENLFQMKPKKFALGSWCRYCEKVLACKEFKKAEKEFYSLEYQGVGRLKTDILARDLEKIMVVGKICSDLEETAKQMINDGTKIKGWTMGTKNGKRVYLKTTTASDLVKITGLKKAEVIEEKLLSPAQIEKKKKKIDLSSVTFKTQNSFLIKEKDIFKRKEEEF